MRFDKFLALLFSKRSVALILVIVIGAFCLSACSLTLEDVLCLTFCGCVSFDTCREMIWSCGDCSFCNADGGDDDGACDNGSCVGDAYNGCFGCVWEGGPKDCRPSKVCDSCASDEDDSEYEPKSCDECTLDCLDGCIGMLEN